LLGTTTNYNHSPPSPRKYQLVAAMLWFMYTQKNKQLCSYCKAASVCCAIITTEFLLLYIGKNKANY